MTERTVKPWSRVLILLLALAAALVLSRYFTGSWIPTRSSDALMFQNSLLLVVLGSAVIEHKFTVPADSVVNGLMGMITLVTVYRVAPRASWWVVFGYCAVVFAAAVICTVVSTGPGISGWRKWAADKTFRPAVVFGRARVLYSIVFLYGLLAFYGLQDPRTIAFVIFWGVFIALWPMGVPGLLSALARSSPTQSAVGEVVRSDWPDLLRVRLHGAAHWPDEHHLIYAQADGARRVVFPLYSRVEQDGVLGTALCGPAVDLQSDSRAGGFVYSGADEEKEVLRGAAEATDIQDLLGFVIEDSSVAAIRFETWRPDLCAEGALVYVDVGHRRVYYQMSGGLTKEETLEANRHGFQVGLATQLGIIDEERGFAKFNWLPPMNAPVFRAPDGFGADVFEDRDGDFTYGHVPGTRLPIRGGFVKAMEYHTAILGVTGSGKTELAFDLIGEAVESDVKVLCIDITAKYEDRLTPLCPENLSIKPETAAELSERLFAVETGRYGAPDEKAALREYSDQMREEVHENLEQFLLDPDKGRRLGIVTLEEISNTKASIFITELFLTALLKLARDQSEECPRVLVVVEEAHTVIPETSTMGLGDYDSRGLVGKIAQIALQGRKYGVGLLVIAQRTATVSKTVLTQCNTMITLNCFDDTSLKFLRNVYGSEHTDRIANLPFLHAIVYGKAVRSDRPVMIEVPYSEAKAETASA